MRVPYSYLEEQFADSEAILRDIKGLLESAQYTLGPAVAQFEAAFARLCGARFAVGVGTGTDALFLSLKALGVGPGDEVITAANTFIATAGAIVAAGARPAFVDAGDDFNIDPAGIERAITPRTRAIIPVHYAGQPAKMGAILPLAAAHGLPVVEDACQAIGAAIDGHLVSSFGVAAGFSLHPLKNLNVWGDGGVVVTSSEELDATLRLLRNHGLRGRDEVEVFGYNSRLDTLQAIVGNHLIKDVEAITAARIGNARALDAGLAPLAPRVRIPTRRAGERHVFHLYMFEAEDRDRLLAHLLARGVEAKIHYPVPLHLQPAGRRLGYREGDFPEAERQATRIITLPVHQHLSREQVDHMIEAVTDFYRKGAPR
ncbi:MAG: DegT/DnrJ/EryC1/StrS family aminotransferase [Candidatus Rokubacteria bacterium]|nr:DegT/DnrJ/EryC1/StrS family aminotransferase [Candidatus Rokubacteria bacterium]